MGNQRISILLVIICVAVFPFVRANEEEDAKAKLAKAREVHTKTLAPVRLSVAKQIDARVKSEEGKKNPNILKIESLQADRVAIEKGTFPKWIDAKQAKRISDANEKLIVALREMKAAYVRAKDLDKAKAIEEEISRLEGPNAVNRNQAAKIIGSWLMVSNISDGKDSKNFESERWIVTFSENGYVTTKGGMFVHSGTWEVDASKDPMELRQDGLRGTATGGHFLGIYKWDGEEIIHCGGTSLPIKFESLPGQKRQMMRLRRVPPNY